jgi:hypothetical protein
MFEKPSSAHEFMKSDIREKANIFAQEISSLLTEEKKNIDLLREKIDGLKKIISLGFIPEDKKDEYQKLIESAEVSL